MKATHMLLAALPVLGIGLYALGYFGPAASSRQNDAQSQPNAAKPASAPAVSVVRAKPASLRERVRITGTLVPRLEILIAPEVEGLRVVELVADEGDRVVKGQVLARLETETLKVQLAQNDASQARAEAAIAQARSAIVSAEAKEVEARNALDRGKPLKSSGAITEAVLDQRESAARTAVAMLRSARDGLTLAEADRNLIVAQRRDIAWKLSRTELKSPTDGVVNRRATRIGGVASGSAVAEPMFRIIADGQIELEAEVPEIDIARLKAGQKARITLAGTSEVEGEIRLVSPEVDKATRQGKVRISLGNDPALRIGSFARGSVETQSSTGLTVPTAAVLYGADGATVMLVTSNRVALRKVTTGLDTGEMIEIRSGLADGDTVVAKSGTFLRDGDQITPVPVNQAALKVN